MTKQDYKIISIDFICDTTSVPNFLLVNYRDFGLNEKDLVFLLELISIKRAAKVLTRTEVEEKTPFSAEEVAILSASLIEKGFLKVNCKNEILLGSLYDKFREAWALENIKQQTEAVAKVETESLDKEFGNLYKKFEIEMGRPLSAIEGDKIKDWFYELKLPGDLIYEALTRAVLMGKYNFAYINGILKDWQSQKLLTVSAVKAAEAERATRALEREKSKKEPANKVNYRKNQTNNSFEDLYEV